ncbi:M15 family metallopeptidase [Paracoccus sp. KR1-242]|uniref:M15 family metallopeptidase n=1 Tax=Paracoccus sp. KR1-242 TaxID=3410028 RepID=UPI003C057A18
MSGSPTPQKPPHRTAADGLVDYNVVNSLKLRNRQIACSPAGSDVRIVEFAQAFIKELDKRGMPFFAHCYLRGKAAQEAALKAGHSNAGFGRSPHNVGMAVDIVHFGRFWELTRDEWAVLGLIGKEVARKRCIKVTWGGDFRSIWDPAHWELANWRTVDFIPWPKPSKEWRQIVKYAKQSD